jgi:hypothetical protein
MGGLWGFKNYLHKYPIKKKIEIWLRKLNRDFKRMDDMKFLDRYIYEQFKDSMISHDDYFNYPDSIKFPCEKKLGYYEFCGEVFDENDNKETYDRDFKIFTDLVK